MPPPIAVVLQPHSPEWVRLARRESERLSAALSPNLLTVEHVGSTAIPTIRAKPIVDLMPIVTDLEQLEQSRDRLESLGYAWWGELGLPGRRYYTLEDLATGIRRVQLHCYELGSPAIDRHLAFRDYLLAHPDVALEYEAEKLRCRALHPNDSHAYTDCKTDWIKAVETTALNSYRLPAQMS